MRARLTLLFWPIYAVALVLYFHHLGLEWDTGQLIEQTRGSLDCVGRGQWTGCLSGGSYPLLQKIPSAAWIELGFKNGLVIRLLAVVTILLSAGSIFLAFRSLRRRSETSAWIFALVLLIGPFLWYTRSSFSEGWAAAFILAAAVSLRDRWNPLWSMVFLLGAGLSKETAFPFLILLTALALSLREADRARVSWREGIYLSLGIAVPVFAGIAHNFFRFGTWVNLNYLDPVHLVQNGATQLNFFFALLVSKNGGLLFFWPSFVALLVIFIFRAPRAGVWIAVILAGLTLGFSKWAYPFGWLSWGPRFYIPWIPGMSFLLLSIRPSPVENIFRACFKTPRRFVVFSLLLAALLFPHAVAWYDRALVDWIILPDSGCPTAWTAQENKAGYIECVKHQAWSKDSILLRAFDPSLNPNAFVLSLVVCLGLIHLLIRLRSRIISPT